MTNHPWSFSVAELQRVLGVGRLRVRNDFEAMAAALPTLGDAGRRQVGGGSPQAGAALAVLGPGTGLGVGGLAAAVGGRYAPIAGEGGHVTLAATTPREAAVLAWLGVRFGHASAERALSGPGLVNLHAALCAIDGQPALTLQPADVVRGALGGRDPVCHEALQLFAAFLGNVAGNLALTLGARGGVYVGGGIVPQLGAAFDASPFRARFEAKGRFRGYLEQVPTWVITAPTPALQGAVNALDAAAG